MRLATSSTLCDLRDQAGERARFAVVMMLILGAPAAVGSDDQDVITYRQLIMKQLDAEAAALGMMVSGQIPADGLSSEAISVANAAQAALKAFEPKVPGGEAKPEVWAKWPDCHKRMQDFAKKSAEMAKVSESGNVAAVAELMVNALPCKECHDIYRNKKK